MGAIRLGPGKKRYGVTLDEARTERIKSLIREVGFPRNYFSTLLNEQLIGMETILKQIVEAKRAEQQLNLEDLINTTVAKGRKHIAEGLKGDS